MKYIKGFDKNLMCRDMQYEVGKSCRVKGKLELCSNGIHFCDSWFNVMNYYNDPDSRYCEVEPVGKILKGDDKYCARGIKVLRELTIKEIVDEFIPDIEAKDNYGRTPLYVACYYGHTELATYLIDKGADIEAKDKDGWTPLYVACYYGYTELATYLIDKGADIEAKDNYGRIPLHRACYKGHTEIAEYIRQHGAKY